MVLNNILNMKMKGNVEIGDHVAQLESQISRLATMVSVLEEKMKVILLLSSLRERSECIRIISFVYTIQEEIATWSYVTKVILGKESDLIVAQPYQMKSMWDKWQWRELREDLHKK